MSFPYVPNHYLVFVGADRPQNAQIGDHITIYAFESESDCRCTLYFTVKDRIDYPEATELKGTATYDSGPHDCVISLHPKTPFVDLITIAP